MREIKFKVIIEETGELLCHEWLTAEGWVNDFYSAPESSCCFYNEWMGDGFLKHIKRLQWTGLKDKNGLDIYEGDILKYHTGAGCLRKVIYKNAAFHSVTLEEEKGSPNHPMYFLTLAPTGTSGIEVIGNIYTHAHLLDPNEVSKS